MCTGEFTGFHQATLPFPYIGVPIDRVHLPVSIFDSMVEKITSKIEGWKVCLLSFGGKLTLVKSVTNSRIMHALSMIKAPAKVLKKNQSKIIAPVT